MDGKRRIRAKQNGEKEVNLNRRHRAIFMLKASAIKQTVSENMRRADIQEVEVPPRHGTESKSQRSMLVFF